MNMNVAGLSADKVSVGSQGYGHISRLRPHRKVKATSPVQILCSVCSHTYGFATVANFFKRDRRSEHIDFYGFLIYNTFSIGDMSMGNNHSTCYTFILCCRNKSTSLKKHAFLHPITKCVFFVNFNAIFSRNHVHAVV